MAATALLLIEVSAREAELIDLIDDIEYGEILDPVIDHHAKRTIETSADFVALITLLRKHTVTRIVVHNSRPSIVEIAGERAGFKYLRKIKPS